jgi:hypothetical protein
LEQPAQDPLHPAQPPEQPPALWLFQISLAHTTTSSTTRRTAIRFPTMTDISPPPFLIIRFAFALEGCGLVDLIRGIAVHTVMPRILVSFLDSFSV